MDARVPDSMVGHGFRYHPGTPDPDRLGRLDRDATNRERLYRPVTFAYVVLQVALYAVALHALTRRRGPAGLTQWLRAGTVALAAWPLATYVFRAVPGTATLGFAALSLLLLIEAALVALALRAHRRPLQPLQWLAGATACLIAVDVATGARLQVASIMGYSPQDGGRFFGIGNVAFAILAVTSILAVSLHLERAPRRGEALLASGIFLALVVVIDGAPWLGSDVGGTLTLVPVLGLMVYRLAGGRMSWRAVTVAVTGTAVIVAVAGTVDLLRSTSGASHLGSFVHDLVDGDASGTGATLARKVAANLEVLRITGAAGLPLIAATVLYLLVRGRRMAALLPPGRPLRTGLVAALAAGLVGAVVNDSGVVITALSLAYVAPVITLLALERARGGREVGAAA
jgi:hypothetical protein